MLTAIEVAEWIVGAAVGGLFLGVTCGIIIGRAAWGRMSGETNRRSR